jgi:hypothetical protein
MALMLELAINVFSSSGDLHQQTNKNSAAPRQARCGRDEEAYTNAASRA